MKLYPVYVKKVTTVISGVATAIFGEKVNRSEGVTARLRISESVQRGEGPILKQIAFTESTQRGDVYRIPTISVTGTESVQHGDKVLGTITVNESCNRSDAPKYVLDFFTAGTYSWVAPFTGNIQIEVWAAGAAGGPSSVTAGGGGGGGGAYSKTNTLAVTAGTTYHFVVGAGGPSTGVNGGDSWFSTTAVAPTSTAQGALAKGGTTGTAPSGTTQGAGGPGGVGTSGIGDTRNSGGAGGGGVSLQTAGGGGGGGAGSGGVGGNGTGGTAPATAGTGGSGTALGGGPGGTGNAVGAGTDGTQAGGGGGGPSTTQTAARAGAPGRVRLTSI